MSCICSTDTIEPEKLILYNKCRFSHLGDYRSHDQCNGCYRCDNSKKL